MRDRIHSWGVVLTLFGGAGMSENITSGRGSFMFSAIVFSIGYSCVLSWWIRGKEEK